MRRVLFLLIVALIAAAIGDQLVESIANTGIVGAGYADDNHVGVLPALIVGALLLLGAIVMRSVSAWSTRGDNGRSPCRAVTGELTRVQTLRMLPLLLVIQLAMVFAIECIEALLAGEALPAGFSWLGGPLLLSLGIHAAIALLCAAACAALVRWAVGSVVALISDALHFIRLRTVRERFGSRAAERGESPLHVNAPPVRQIGGRAPPRPRFVTAS